MSATKTMYWIRVDRGTTPTLRQVDVEETRSTYRLPKGLSPVSEDGGLRLPNWGTRIDRGHAEREGMRDTPRAAIEAASDRAAGRRERAKKEMEQAQALQDAIRALLEEV